MAGHTNFETLRAKMSPQQRERSAQKLEELNVEMLLAELRKHSGMTQRELADILGIKQPTLSAREKQDDMEIGTVQTDATFIGTSRLKTNMPVSTAQIGASSTWS